MIEVVGLRKNFGNIPALMDISFDVKKGQIVGFLGANGAGKTTTMDILCGYIGADAGSAKIGGYEIAEHPIEVKKRIGYLPDDPPLHKEMRVVEFLEYAGRIHGLKGLVCKNRVEELIAQLDLGSMRRRLIGQLSKGYKQRVGLAQAIIHSPDVLILDEPTEGLDPNQILQIRELILNLKGRHTILFSSHILSEVESVCDELIIVDRGRVVEKGTHQELVSRLSQGREYALKVREGAAALVEKLRAIPGIQSAENIEGEQTLSFTTVASESILDTVASEVIQGGHGLKELAPRGRKLEDIFFQLTR